MKQLELGSLWHLEACLVSWLWMHFCKQINMFGEKKILIEGGLHRRSRNIPLNYLYTKYTFRHVWWVKRTMKFWKLRNALAWTWLVKSPSLNSCLNTYENIGSKYSYTAVRCIHFEYSSITYRFVTTYLNDNNDLPSTNQFSINIQFVSKV